MGDWILENLAWMHWTVASATAFISLFCVLIFMGVWDKLSPAYARKGFLPMATTRGDRLFIVIMTTIGVFFLWLGLIGTTLLWGAALVSVACAAVLFRWG